jgi:hypothetical protein
MIATMLALGAALLLALLKEFPSRRTLCAPQAAV